MLRSREKTGPLSYKITTRDQGNWCRHADQMLSTSFEQIQPSEILRTFWWKSGNQTLRAEQFWKQPTHNLRQRSLLHVIRYRTGNLLTDCHISKNRYIIVLTKHYISRLKHLFKYHNFDHIPCIECNYKLVYIPVNTINYCWVHYLLTNSFHYRAQI